MVRDNIKAQIANQSTAGKAGIVLAAVIAMVIARQGAFILEGAGDVATVVGGLPVMVLFFGGLYVGAMAVIGIYNDLNGESEEHPDLSG